MSSNVSIKPRKAVSITMFIVSAPFFILSVVSMIKFEFLAAFIFLAIGALLWLPVFSKRIVLSDGRLECRILGFRLWGATAADANATIGKAGDYGGLPAYIIRNASGDKVGSISLVQFPLSDIRRLLAAGHIRDESSDET